MSGVSWLDRLTGWRVVALLALVAIAVRWQTFGNPVLEFDEQFYLLVGDRMLHGALPFVDIFDRKPVGLFLIYAAIRTLGGEGVIQYQLVALVFVIATATLLYRFASRLSSNFGALAAALAYIIWLNITEGEGGQTPVFYNLLMLVAAMLTAMVATGRTSQPLLLGTTAMALTGLAIQVKYTVLVEGIYFGIVLLWANRQTGAGWARLAVCALLWVTVALIPTITAGTTYAWLGHWREFEFANFESQFGRTPFAWPYRLIGLAALTGLLLPLLGCIRRIAPHRDVATWRFVIGWLIAALASILIFGSFMSTHYSMPVLMPAVLAAAPLFGRDRRGRLIAIVLLLCAAVAGQIALAANEWAKGGRREAMIVAKAAKPHRGCIYVYDGYPALYQLTGSCLPTRYAFPGHLNTSDEGSASALGTDPVQELYRILATKPEVIVDDSPIFMFHNPATRAIINDALARDYHRVLKLQTGSARFRMVYRRNLSVTPDQTYRRKATGSISTGRM